MTVNILVVVFALILVVETVRLVRAEAARSARKEARVERLGRVVKEHTEHILSNATRVNKHAYDIQTCHEETAETKRRLLDLSEDVSALRMALNKPRTRA